MPVVYVNQSYKTASDEFKKVYFSNLLKRTNGAINDAAQIAGISRQALHNILKEFNIDKD